jgi:SAM-dependent methyltransferase
VSEMWNSVASGWDASAEFVDKHLALATEALLDAAAISEGDSVLELAAGPGGAGLAAAARVGTSGSVLLSDAAAEMVAVAERRAGASAHVSTAVFDQSAIEAENGRFDAVIVRHGLMFAEDPVAAVREAARVLRGGGHYAAMTWGPRELNPWLGLVLDAVGEQFGVPFPPPNVRGPFSLDQPESLRATLQDGGLVDVRVETVSTPMRLASLTAWWGQVPKLAGPLAIALEGMEPDVRGAIEQRALEAGAKVAHSTDAGIEFSGTVLIGSGRTAAG